MIALAQTLPIGNAVRVLLAPSVPDWKLLRKTALPFVSDTDPDAIVIAADTQDVFITDTNHLVNGTTYYYCQFEDVAGVWTPTPVVPVIPNPSYGEVTWDAFLLLRDRLDYGLQIEVARGTLVHEGGRIPVLTAPPVFEDTRWPVVTVHLTSEAPLDRALAEMVAVDQGDTEYEGWLARSQITVMAWTLNPDERIELRKALRRIVVGNLPVFEGAGMTQIEFQMQDTEDFQSYNTAVYQVMCTFSCTVPVAVAGHYPLVTTVNAVAIPLR